jgi:hypothetical protein
MGQSFHHNAAARQRHGAAFVPPGGCHMGSAVPTDKEIRMRLPVILAAFLVSTPAFALDLPARKAGLWEMKMQIEGGRMPAQTFQHCIDAATDKKMNAMGPGTRSDQCSKQDVTQSGGTITIDSVCNFGAGTTTTHAVVTGDFNSGYTVTSASKREGGPSIPGMPAETKMTIEAKWTGACKADQKPGDMMLPNGMKMNINDQPQGIRPGMPKR